MEISEHKFSNKQTADTVTLNTYDTHFKQHDMFPTRGLQSQRAPAGIVGARTWWVPAGARITYICGRGQSRTKFAEMCGCGCGHGHKCAGVGTGVDKYPARTQPAMPA